MRLPNACLAFLLLAAPALAQQAPAFEVRPATSDIRIDALLDEPAWAAAAVIPLPYEWFPGDNVEPPVKTDALVTYDSRNLYVAFRAWDPRPSEIRAHLMDRDSINTFVQDDHVTLMIDPFNDQRRAFQFRVNPLGVQADAIFSQIEGIEDFSWDIIWASAGRITEEGYIVEIAIPLNQIRFPQGGGVQTWGFELGRSYPRNARHRISASPRNRNETCILCQVNKVTGFQRLQAGRNLEVVPTLTTTRSDRAAFPSTELEPGDTRFDPGVSVRWGVTPATTVNATINPDFSQVEADAAQLAENERFALFFEEKRPFFLEGIDFFATPINAVFTRTVADPAWGLKATSKQGRNAMGVFVTRDERNNILIPSNQGSAFAFLDDSVTASVLRYRRDVGTGSTVGVLYAGREGDRYHNRVAGVDGFFPVTPAAEVRVQYLRSDTRYPDEFAVAFGQERGSFDGGALRLTYQHVDRNWIWFAGYQDFEPGFRADSGFVPRVDLRRADAALRRRFWGKPTDWWTNWSVSVDGLRSENHAGVVTDETMRIGSTVGGPRQSLLDVRVSRNAVRFQDRLHEGMVRASAYFEIQPGAIGKFSLFIDGGETVDFANNQPADLLLFVPSAELKLGRHINAQLRRIQQRLDVREGRLSETAINELRLVYNFNVRSFVRAIAQHQDTERDPSLFRFPVQRRTESLFSQLLFSYKLNPQTVLFLGYSDSHLGI
ncbi:MAG TPA: DUF5916 domain-containing protein, partial [Thermoanaerobaculia bacterium]|nr:DUF5916 domain-containing protein [Thermoanaerobaculia bacterium]